VTARTRSHEVEALLLAPGAGTDASHPSLLAIEQAVAPLPVRRFDFPYRKAGRRAPDRAPVLLQAVREEIDATCAEWGVGRVVVGGRSMGGRMCSMVAAEGHAAIVGLVAICYPLHPPGKPEKLRTEHLPDVKVPCLFVSGDRDPFGSPQELEAATSVVPGPVTHHWLPGKRHDLKGADAEIAEVVTDWIRAL
jgi:predicted alpha/beta-hydrolase family hydrolase